MSKVKTIDELAKELEVLRKNNKVVLCHGCFDLLHIGHLRYLQAARRQGDILVVTVSPDGFVGKGPGRPVFHDKFRAEMLAALDCVDYVAINEWPSAVEAIKKLKPDVYAKGDEFEGLKDASGYVAEEVDAIESISGRMYFTHEITSSSSGLLNNYYQTREAERMGLKEKAKWVRQQVLEMCVAAGGGHIAPSFSCTEILVALHQGGVLNIDPKNPKWEDRDRFILSKGQAAVALYAVLADMGFLSVEELLGHCQEGSRLGGHAEDNVPGVDCFTGSLGHGLPIGAGMALAAKMNGKRYKVFVLLGDGECQEGSVWEAAMFASHHHLDNLIAIVDRNGLEATDFTEDVVSLDPFLDKWQAFGWSTRTVGGHSFETLLPILQAAKRPGRFPLCIVAHTTKGKGLSFMENVPIWHYRIPEGEELDRAREELA